MDLQHINKAFTRSTLQFATTAKTKIRHTEYKLITSRMASATGFDCFVIPVFIDRRLFEVCDVILSHNLHATLLFEVNTIFEPWIYSTLTKPLLGPLCSLQQLQRPKTDTQNTS